MTAKGVLSALLSVAGFILTLVGFVGNQKQLTFFNLTIDDFLAILGVMIIVFLIGYFSDTLIRHRKKKYATNYKSFEKHRIYSVEELDIQSLSQQEQNCIHLIHTSHKYDKFWESSWLGCGENNKVGGILVMEDGNVRGKIPMRKMSFFKSQKMVFSVEFEHNIGSHWNAIIRGRYGKPTLDWQLEKHDVSGFEYLTFWARTSHIVKNPQTDSDRDNPQGDILINVRMTDLNQNRSGDVIIKIPNWWSFFKISLSKFINDKTIYKDFNHLTESSFFHVNNCFRYEDLASIRFGNTPNIPSQSASLQLYNIRFA